MSYSEKDGEVILSKVRDFLLIVANEGASQVFLKRNARELIIELDQLLKLIEGINDELPRA